MSLPRVVLVVVVSTVGILLVVAGVITAVVVVLNLKSNSQTNSNSTTNVNAITCSNGYSLINGICVGLYSTTDTSTTTTTTTKTTTINTTLTMANKLQNNTTSLYVNQTCSYGYIYENGACIECGLTFNAVNLKIIGGIEANQNSWPAQVLVLIGSNICGGTLISQRTVLTAAHCVYNVNSKQFISPSNVNVYVGLVYDPFGASGYFAPASSMKSVTKIIGNSEYDASTYKNDIALLILTTSVNLNTKIQIACLPPGESNTYPTPTTNAWAVGWGLIQFGSNYLPDNLYNVKLPINNASTCSALLIFDSDSQICAGVLGKDTCQGDSGGGLYVLDTSSGTSRYVVSGITSNGYKCGVLPGIYTRVSYYYNWIISNWVK